MYFDAKYMPNHLVIPLFTKDRLKHYDFKKTDIYSLEGNNTSLFCKNVFSFGVISINAKTQALSAWVHNREGGTLAYMYTFLHRFEHFLTNSKSPKKLREPTPLYFACLLQPLSFVCGLALPRVTSFSAPMPPPLPATAAVAPRSYQLNLSHSALSSFLSTNDDF